MQSFKQYTAKQILDMLKKQNIKTILEQLAFYKKAHHKEKIYQIWEEGYQPKFINSDEMMKIKIDYIHQNPVKRGYIDDAVHWRYSSARDYCDMNELIEVDRFW